MDPPSSIPLRSSGIPRPSSSRLPVLRPSASQSQLRSSTAGPQVQRKPSLPTVSRPQLSSHGAQTLQKKTSRSSIARSTTPSTSTLPNTSSSRASLTSASRRVPSINASSRTSSIDSTFKKPIGRPQSRQTRHRPPPVSASREQGVEEDVLGDLDGFRSASRASSRAGSREQDMDNAAESDPEPVEPPRRKARPSLSDRTIESLSQLPASPAGKGRRRSSFFSADNSMPPPARPASALGGSNRRPTTSDGTPQPAPATPRRLGGLTQRGSMTAPGKRSASTTLPSTTSTPSKASTLRTALQPKAQPLAQRQNLQSTPRARPLSNSKTMTARTPKSRPSLTGIFDEATSPPGTAAPLTPPPGRQTASNNRTPETSRKVSNSSAALREQIAKAKAARRSDVTVNADDTPRKVSSSSGTLREQIAKAKEAARQAHATKQFRVDTPPKEVPAVTENEFGIEPDPEEVSQFDFGFDDPFNQTSKGGKSVLRKRVDGARADGRLNIAAMALSEMPEEVLNMYKFNSDDATVAWGEVVDLTTMIAADNEFATLPEKLFPDVDPESSLGDDEDGPQFGAVQSIDLHGNMLTQLPIGLKWLSQLSKLNLARNQLSADSFDVISRISSLREVKLSENKLLGALPGSVGSLKQLEVLEVQGNKLTSLPKEICELVHLRTLNISENLLTTVPSELFTSVPIVELIATKNNFSGSFFDVDTVPHLQNLQLSNNSLASLCVTGTILLPALKTLNVSANRLSALPDISSWTSLTTLLAGENKLSVFPEGFVTLQQLRSADFSANNITKLDEKIAVMNGLMNLTLVANPLRDRKFLSMETQDIKRDLMSRLEPTEGGMGQDEEGADAAVGAELSHEENGWQLKPSGTLDLSSQNLSELDEGALLSFAERNDVRQLYLQQNCLTVIPNMLSGLPHLTLLDLSKNNMSTPLMDRLELPRLRELRLSGNKLQSLGDLLTLLSAPALQHLDVSNNRLSGTLPSMRDTFPGLILLIASDNAISEVSAKVLEGLKVVNLSNNEIPKLDPRIGLLQGTLTSLDVEGNTFRVPNYAVLQKGTDAVLNWLRDKVPLGDGETF
ncbi:L domain-like protein [Polyplosphaeria fusca]|uniref:L domain-like protein n=1 Tax=Polyplosphaeria fusca TaxID=682080 RepID=A0A9P4QVQ2_9PLEO|nr:L domain-like protein [Polyplosphaeria fusca]